MFMSYEETADPLYSGDMKHPLAAILDTQQQLAPQATTADCIVQLAFIKLSP